MARLVAWVLLLAAPSCLVAFAATLAWTYLAAGAAAGTWSLVVASLAIRHTDPNHPRRMP